MNCRNAVRSKVKSLLLPVIATFNLRILVGSKGTQKYTSKAHYDELEVIIISLCTHPQ
jgi:hypothetical protein